MRDYKRISKFCDRLAAVWACVPDWRFGQLMSNMLGEFVHRTGKDIFFPEDDELIEFFEKYMEESHLFNLSAELNAQLKKNDDKQYG